MKRRKVVNYFEGHGYYDCLLTCGHRKTSSGSKQNAPKTCVCTECSIPPAPTAQTIVDKVEKELLSDRSDRPSSGYFISKTCTAIRKELKKAGL